jgi:PAS domain S-box-containing protein
MNDPGLMMVERFRELLESAPVVAFMKDAQGRYLYANRHAIETYGEITGPNGQGKTDSEIWPPEIAAQIRASDDEVRHSTGMQVFSQTMPLADGPHEVLFLKFVIPAGGPEVTLCGIGFDLTGHSRSEEQRDRLAAVVEQASESVMMVDLQARITYVNPAFERVTGYSRDEVIGQNPRILASGLQPPSFYEAMWASIMAGEPWVADIVNRRKDGSLFTESAMLSALRAPSGSITGYMAVKRDVTNERAAEERANSAIRERVLITETVRALQPGDTPEAAAQAICRQVASLSGIAAAQLLFFESSGHARPMGFVVAGREDPPKQRLAFQRSRQLQKRAAHGPWVESWQNLQGHPFDQLVQGVGPRSLGYAPVRYSQGLVGLLVVQARDTVDKASVTEALPALIEFADLAGALLGREVADRGVAERRREHVAGIITHRAFRPVFQPIVDLSRDEIVGYEALTRFTDDSDPETVFAEAVEVGLGPELEIATMRAAFAAAECLPRSAWLNVNASPDLILSGHRLRPILEGWRKRVVLEVTEHTAIADFPAFRAAVAALGPKVELAVDDAGAGFAGLRHIFELRPSFVKLDRWLVAGLDSDEARQAMIVGLRHFARSTGCRLIAEGIETERELAALKLLDIQLGQGYLLGRPAAVDASPARDYAAV